jgi:hypothetical protein
MIVICCVDQWKSGLILIISGLFLPDDSIIWENNVKSSVMRSAIVIMINAQHPNAERIHDNNPHLIFLCFADPFVMYISMGVGQKLTRKWELINGFFVMSAWIWLLTRSLLFERNPCHEQAHQTSHHLR